MNSIRPQMTISFFTGFQRAAPVLTPEGRQTAVLAFHLPGWATYINIFT